jgi:aryl-alcohol dehydrogenase-like predicted oxidoreductase
MAPTRREVLGVAAGGALAFASIVNAQPRPAMLTRPIPSTKEPLPVVGLGTWQTFDVGADREALDQRKEVLRILFEAGGRVIDSSPMYGRAEEVVGTLLAEMGARDKAFLATKVWTSGEAAGSKQMQASAAKLRAPVIDLMQIHNLVDWRTHLRTLRAWKEQKKFRYIGITHYTDPALDELAAIVRAERIDFVQFGYSIASRAAEARLLPLCAERGVAVIVNQPFDSGALFGQVRGKALPDWGAEIDCASWSQFFLKFILGHPAVTCVIPGTARSDHARDNFAAGHGRLPDAAQRQRMVEFWERRAQ